MKLVWRDKGLEFDLSQTLKIGRNTQNDLRISSGEVGRLIFEFSHAMKDALVSGRHATIKDQCLIDPVHPCIELSE